MDIQHSFDHILKGSRTFPMKYAMVAKYYKIYTWKCVTCVLHVWYICNTCVVTLVYYTRKLCLPVVHGRVPVIQMFTHVLQLYYLHMYYRCIVYIYITGVAQVVMLWVVFVKVLFVWNTSNRSISYWMALTITANIASSSSCDVTCCLQGRGGKVFYRDLSMAYLDIG